MLFYIWVTFAGWSFFSLQETWWWTAAPPPTPWISCHMACSSCQAILMHHFYIKLPRHSRMFWDVHSIFLCLFLGQPCEVQAHKKSGITAWYKKNRCLFASKNQQQNSYLWDKENKFWFWSINLHEGLTCQ